MRRFIALLVVAFVGMGATVSIAKDLSIKAFEGLWEGTAVSYSNTSANFKITSRDLDVDIRPAGADKFTVTWRTIQRQTGVPNAPDEVLKETTRTYMREAGGKVWHMQPAGDVTKGEPVSWAVLKKQTLSIYSMGISKNGGYDMLIYDRTLTGLNMKLAFKALRNGVVRRTAEGTLIRSGK